MTHSQHTLLCNQSFLTGFRLSKEVEVISEDAGYKTPWIYKKVFDSGRIPSLLSKRPLTEKGGLSWNKYVYDEYYNCVLCLRYKVLEYAGVHRASGGHPTFAVRQRNLCAAFSDH